MVVLTESRQSLFLGRTGLRRRVSAASLLALSIAACDRETEERPLPANTTAETHGQSGKPTLPAELSPAKPAAEQAAATPAAPPPPHPGPWFIVTKSSTGIFENANFDKQGKFGYARNGERLPVKAAVVSTDNCSGGWYAIVSGGFVCGNSGTVDDKSPDLKFVQKPPNLDEVLPYRYARNAKNGTPLYRSIPTREQMLAYEPYLEDAKKAETPETDKPSAAGSKPWRRASVSFIAS